MNNIIIIIKNKQSWETAQPAAAMVPTMKLSPRSNTTNSKVSTMRITIPPRMTMQLVDTLEEREVSPFL
jgi:hypothetical protein